MGNTLTRETFIERANSKHGNLFDYSNVLHVDRNTKVEIICKNHGSFYQTPNGHLSGCGCNKCAIEQNASKNRHSEESVISKFIQIHGYRYDYSKVKYINTNTKVIIGCSIHGEFEQKPTKHLRGQGCNLCSYKDIGVNQTKSGVQLLDEFHNVHGTLYDYSKVVYTRMKDPIVIGCPIHGDFIQKAVTHWNGCGCPICKRYHNIYSRSKWSQMANGRVGTFYIIRCYNEIESFYKYGITFNGLKYRYKRCKDMPYSYEIIRLVISSDKEYIWDLEKRFGSFKLKDKYTPMIPFPGSISECFSSYNDMKRTR